MRPERETDSIRALREALATMVPRKDPRGGLRIARLALKQARRSNDVGNIISALLLSAHCHQYRGDTAAALADAEEARMLSRQSGNQMLESECRFRIASIHQSQGEFWKTLEYVMPELEELERLGMTRLIARACGMIGEIYIHLGVSLMALEYLQRGLALWNELGEPDQAGQILGSLGTLYHVHLRNPETAMSYFTRGLDAVRQSGDRMLESSIMISIAGLHAHRGEAKRSLWYLQRSLAIARNHGFGAREANALIGLGMAHGKASRHQSALRYFTRGLARAAEANHLALRTRASLFIGLSHMHMNDRDAALLHLHSALADAENLQLHAVALECHESLTVLHEHFGDHASALRHHRALMQLKHRSDAERYHRMVEWLQSRYRLERAEAEKEVLRLKSDALELQTRNITRELTALSLQAGEQNALLAMVKGNLQEIASLPPERIASALTDFIGRLGAAGGSAGAGTVMQNIGSSHEEFIHNLAKEFPSLTPTELKVCSLLRMNIPNREIAGLLALSIRSIEDHRYQIRKKLGLEKGTHLTVFLAAR